MINIRSLNTKCRLSKRDPDYETTRRGISTFIFYGHTSLLHVQTCLAHASARDAMCARGCTCVRAWSSKCIKPALQSLRLVC